MLVAERSEDGESSLAQDETESTVHRGMMFFTVALALMMMSLDSTIVATILKELQHSLGTSVSWVAWTMTIYSLGFMIMLPITGRLGDTYGRRRVFVISVFVFTLASLLCGFAQNISTLIFLRFLQAAGGAGFTPSATGIIVDHFGKSRDRAVGLFGSIFPIGAIIGPIVGALLVDWLSWRWTFFVNVPMGAIILFLTYRIIPPDSKKAPDHSSHLDFVGMILLGLSIFLCMLAASELTEPGHHIGSKLVAIPGIAGILCLIYFAIHIRRKDAPFIEPRLILGRGFGAVNMVNFIFGGAVLGMMSLVPLYAINRYNMDVLNAGTLLIAQGVAAIIFSLLGTAVLRASGHRMPILIGAIVCIVGLSLLALEPPWGLTPKLWLMISTFIIGCGIGGANPASRNAGLELAPEHSGTQAALRSLFMQAGGIVIVSVTTALIAAAGKGSGAMQEHVIITFAILLIPCLILVKLVPEHHGAW